MNDRVGKPGFKTNVHPPQTQDGSEIELTPSSSSTAKRTLMTMLFGAGLSAAFYGMVYATAWAPLQRYFLGHPIAIAATVLFWTAVAVLVTKWMAVTAQANQLATIRDEDLVPPDVDGTPANRWLEQNDAGHVARRWLTDLAKLPSEVRDSLLVARLEELLTRQSQRGSTKHLADDLREISGRDADASHDSFGLVRIIVWAIPMLGFLGTVIGITQTLGGLDFSNGSTAVENLKSGLYVAFDTTAIGLVLSVVAIFLQFPIERSEQQLLAGIDARVGHLVSSNLPSDETSDNQTALIADLCRGVQVAVAESLDHQARLWRETIDEAQRHWQRVQEDSANKIAEAIDQSLLPALSQHADTFRATTVSISDQVGTQCDQWKKTLSDAQTLIHDSNQDSVRAMREGFETVLRPTLEEHAESIEQSARASADRLEHQMQLWQESFGMQTQALGAQQDTVVRQFEALADTQRGTESILALQKSLDANLQRLTATNAAIDRSVSAAAGDGMAEAMRFLARAVDVLAKRLPEQDMNHDSSRRAA